MEKLIIFFADYLIILLALIVISFWFVPKQKNITLLSIKSTLLAWTIAFIIKNLFYVPRPFVINSIQPLVGFLTDGSFPSSHSAVAFALSISVFIKKPQIGVFMVFISLFLVTARVVGGVHTSVDIISGAVLGTFCAIYANRYLDSYHS